MPTGKSQEADRRQQLYVPVQHVLSYVRGRVRATETVGELWRVGMRVVRKVERSLDNPHVPYPDDSRAFFQRIIPRFGDILRQEVYSPQPEVDPAERAIAVIENMSEALIGEIPMRANKQERLPEPQFISYEDIIVRSNGRVKKSTTASGDPCLIIQEPKRERAEFLIPQLDTVFYKGGWVRVLAKMWVDAPRYTVEAELPPNDADFIVTGKPEDFLPETKRMGSDPDGIEVVPHLNIAQVLQSRDLDINAMIAGKEGIYCTPQALKAVDTGSIHVIGANRGLYGRDTFYRGNLEFATNRGLMRMLKFVAEEKAIQFEIPQANTKVDVGIYWLILARKFLAKPNAPELMDKLFYLAKQLNQVHDGEKNMFDILQRVHREFPFFDVESKALDRTGVARWLTEKLLKQISKLYRQQFGIPAHSTIRRYRGDGQLLTVSLSGYKPSQAFMQNYELYYGRFMKSARERTQKFIEEQEEE